MLPPDVLLNIDALGRALFLADLTGHAAHAFQPVGAVVDEKGEDARVLGGGYPLLRIFDRRKALFGDVTSEEVSRRLRHPFYDPVTQQSKPPVCSSKFVVHTS